MPDVTNVYLTKEESAVVREGFRKLAELGTATAATGVPLTVYHLDGCSCHGEVVPDLSDDHCYGERFSGWHVDPEQLNPVEKELPIWPFLVVCAMVFVIIAVVLR